MTSIEEGLRMDAHPGIVFRDGPTGRRPGLVRGPDVWEVVRVLQNVGGSGEEAVERSAEWLELPADQTRAAARYYAEYRDEIDDWIRRVDREAERAEAVPTFDELFSD